ncbi:MAG: 1-deoxy-D-xylulose-5-phosphate synthase [Oscillospiraceae bacterium]|jgi:1-deoxy-D-xylulose-5-phosphate synthase|nr:1-deoxy-D-xylulose-5-phosphate synthase [Oscillospiraceae bacterium]
MDETRQIIVDTISKTGGHLASNLGIVELTQAIHRVYDPYTDRIVFDVGHQCYPHKIMTGRKEQFGSVRQFGGLSGFPKPSESIADAFIAGHASNSVSVALGMARARTLQGESYEVACLIGDGALTGGLAYEGLENAGHSAERLVVILNDNEMSIAPNVGAVAHMLKRLAERPSYYNLKRRYRKFLMRHRIGEKLFHFTRAIKQRVKRLLLSSGANMFEDLGFRYFGPVDGHDVEKIVFLLKEARDSSCPAIVHVLTTKGKGYEPAELNPDLYHGVSAFDSSKPLEPSFQQTYSTVFGSELTRLAEEDPRICAITAAMPYGTGLDGFAKRFSNRFFDEGITEAHSLTMAAGMAKQGARPVFAVYSTFLQRAYDSLIHDIAMLSLPVVIGVDRCGLVGEDGENHHGIFDLPMLMAIPHLEVYCPATFDELRMVLRAALSQDSHPVAIRYPRGSGEFTEVARASEPCKVTVVAYGTMAINAADALRKSGITGQMIRLVRIKPLDVTEIAKSVRETGRLAVLEDVVEHGCVGEVILAELAAIGVIPRRVTLCNCGSRFVTHGEVSVLWKSLGLDAETFAVKLRELAES